MTTEPVHWFVDDEKLGNWVDFFQHASLRLAIREFAEKHGIELEDKS